MSDITALENRITAALDRVRQGIERRAARSGEDTPKHETGMSEALAAEKAANAELVDRVSALKDRQDTQVAGLTERVESQRAQLAKLDAELQTLRASNVKLREINSQMRAALADGGLTAAQMNAAMDAELAALHAQRSADAAEVDAIIAELKPLIEESANAAG